MVEGIHIGCSGYYYTHWVGRFYPEGTKNRDFFARYLEQFSTVELNTTFYHFPKEKQVESWTMRSGEGFVFSVKGPRLITHLKRLRNARDSILLFLHLIKPLKEAGKLGAILFQTPPSFACDPKVEALGVLREFLAILPPGYRYAFEFRNPSWCNEEVVGLLRERETDFVSVSEKGTTPFDGSLTGFKYFRMHGLGNRYASDYTEEQLSAIADKALAAWDSGARAVFAYFNNDFNAFAPTNALRLMEIVKSRGR